MRPHDGIHNIAVLRALQLGDMMCAVPAIRALRKAYPAARITLIGLPWAKHFVSRFRTLFSDFLEFPGFPGLPERDFDARRFVEFIDTVNRQRYDLAIQMHGNGLLTNALTATFGASRLAGFTSEHAYCPDAKSFLAYPNDIHEIDRHLNLIEHIGVAPQGRHLEFPLGQRDLADYHRMLQRLALTSGNYVCLHPGSRSPDRRWPADRFSLVGDYLAAKGYRVVITGTEEERGIAAQVTNGMKMPAVNLAGKTSLGVAAAFIRNASMLFSNDTGVSHVGAALGTPSVVVFSASDPVRWAPLNANLHKPVLPGQAADLELVLERVDEALRVNDLRQAL